MVINVQILYKSNTPKNFRENIIFLKKKAKLSTIIVDKGRLKITSFKNLFTNNFKM